MLISTIIEKDFGVTLHSKQKVRKRLNIKKTKDQLKELLMHLDKKERVVRDLAEVMDWIREDDGFQNLPQPPEPKKGDFNYLLRSIEVKCFNAGHQLFKFG